MRTAIVEPKRIPLAHDLRVAPRETRIRLVENEIRSASQKEPLLRHKMPFPKPPIGPVMADFPGIVALPNQ